MKRRWNAGLVALALSVLAAAPAGDTYRRPQALPAASGPAVIELTLPPGEKIKKSSRLPEIEFQAVDAAGRGVPGLALHVAVEPARKKDGAKPVGAAAATDAQGRVVLRGNPGAWVSRVFAIFEWDGGAKRVEARLGGTGTGLRLNSASYKRIGDGENEGSCRNLFELQAPTDQVPRYRLRLRVPASLLACEQVVYGAERKVAEIARLEAIGRREVNAGDRNMFSPQDETKMGLEASTAFDKQFEQVRDPQIVGYVERLCKKVVAHSDAPSMPVHLRVVHTDDVNAFVTAGGHIYVFTGLLAAAENESQVAGVLAHEASHAISRHVTEGATRSMKAQAGAVLGSLGLGKLLGLEDDKQGLLTQGALTATGLVTLRYDRRAESEADLLGAQYLWNAGWDPEGIARFFEILAGRGGERPPAWMSTHPPHERRIENGIQWSRAFLPAKDRYLVDTAEFQAVRAKVAKLPPAKQPPKLDERKSLQQLIGETSTWRQVVAAAGAAPPEGQP